MCSFCHEHLDPEILEKYKGQKKFVNEIEVKQKEAVKNSGLTPKDY
jgi:hypothetical protein